MMMRIFWAALSAAVFCQMSPSAFADVKSYALIVGNNFPFENPKLDTLKFADDDAVRYYRFFKRFTEDAFLLTIPDLRTQKRYAAIGNEADPPTAENLNRTVETIAARMASDKKLGHKTVFYFAFSGHGDHSANGEVFLSLLDKGLTGRDLYKNILQRIHADYQHVFIDACYAEGVVGFRGAFDNETDGTSVALSEAEVAAALGAAAASHPGLGIVVSSSSDTTSHEWSKIESGVFTHEVLSALSGAADVNLDGRIEYSELAAFISSANLEVEDTRGRIEVVARPPNRNRNVSIVDLSDFKQVSFLSGDPSGLGHFSIELANGEKYMDANLSAMNKTHIAVPADAGAYLYTHSKEAVLKSGAGKKIELAMLHMTERRIRERGGVEEALRDGLFAAGYGKSFYKGFVDNKGFICVRFDAEVFAIADPNNPNASIPVIDEKRYRKPLAASAFALAGAAAAGAAAFGVLSLSAKNQYEAAGEDTTIDDLNRLNKQYQSFGTASWVMIGIVPVAVAVGIIMLPKNASKKTSAAIRISGTSVTGSF